MLEEMEFPDETTNLPKIIGKPNNVLSILDQQLNFHWYLYQLILFDLFVHLYIGQGRGKFLNRITHAKSIEFAKLEATFTIALQGYFVQTHLISYVSFIPWSTRLSWQWGPAKNET